MTDEVKIYPTAAQCRERAFELLERLNQSKDDGVDSPKLRFVQLRMIDEAQVWAALATVPEPLEEIHGQLIESLNSGPIIPIPELICPHGMAAKVLTDINNPDTAHYTWQPDCTQGCP